MRINHNLLAMNTNRNMGITNGQTSKSMEKLSSGLRINRAGDDAAGLSISEKMRAQIKGLDQASRNAQDGISMLQTAEGALSETHSILQRMRELAVQSSSDTNVNVDRGSIQDEIKQLKSEVDRIAETTEFNTQKLLKGDGSAAKEIGGLKLAETGVVEQETLSGGKITAAAGAQMQLSMATGQDVADLKDKTFEFKFNGETIKLDIKTVATAETAGANTVETSEGGKAVKLTLVDGTTDQDFIMGKIKEALTTAMTENANVDTADYNISLDESTLTIQSKATGTGETISVSGSVGQDALQAYTGPIKHTGTALTGSQDLDTIADFSINGTAVTFTSTVADTTTSLAVAGQYDMEVAEDRLKLQENLQKDIDATALKGTVKVSVGDDGKISIEDLSKDPAHTFAITASAGSLALGLTTGAAANVSTAATTVVDGTKTATGTAEVREKASTTIENFTLANIKGQMLESGIAVDNTDYFTAGGAVTADGAVKFLSGKGLTVGDETIEFYDSREGKYEGTADFAVDLSLAGVSGTAALTDTATTGDVAKILEQVEKQVGNKLKNVTIEADKAANTLKITSREAGIEANSLEVKDGVDRAATDIVGSKFTAEFQIGANEGQTMDVSITDMRSDALGIKDIDLSTKAGAKEAITTIQKAIEKVSAQRSSLGAVQNRLEHSISNLDTSSENLQSAESRIRDVDMAKEMMNYQKNNILQQAAQAMLAQANQAPQGVLQLLR